MPLVDNHEYIVDKVTLDSNGTAVSITLRNPWGWDGAGSDSNTNDGIVTVPVALIQYLCEGYTWSKV